MTHDAPLLLKLGVAPLRLPLELAAVRGGLRLRFAEPLDPASVAPAAFTLRTWSLRRTSNYGSSHHEEKLLPVAAATLSTDRCTVELAIPDLAPAWCYELRWRLRAADGGAVDGVLDGTIQGLGECENRPGSDPMTG